MLLDLYNYPGGTLLRLKWDSERPKHMSWVTKWVIKVRRIWNRLYQLPRLGPQSDPWQGSYWIPPCLGRTSSRTWALGTRSWGELFQCSFPFTLFLAQSILSYRDWAALLWPHKQGWWLRQAKCNEGIIFGKVGSTHGGPCCFPELKRVGSSRLRVEIY